MKQPRSGPAKIVEQMGANAVEKLEGFDGAVRMFKEKNALRIQRVIRFRPVIVINLEQISVPRAPMGEHHDTGAEIAQRPGKSSRMGDRYVRGHAGSLVRLRWGAGKPGRQNAAQEFCGSGGGRHDDTCNRDQPPGSDRSIPVGPAKQGETEFRRGLRQNPNLRLALQMPRYRHQPGIGVELVAQAFEQSDAETVSVLDAVPDHGGQGGRYLFRKRPVENRIGHFGKDKVKGPTVKSVSNMA